jgi:hypothetical protein
VNKYLLAWTVFLVISTTGLAQPDVPAQELAGGDWNQWHNDKKLVFVDGFISGSRWVASNSILPASMFPNEVVRAGAQTIWEKTTEELKKAVANPKTQLLRQYNASDMMMYAMFDDYMKNTLYERAIIKVPTQTIVGHLNQLYANSANLNVPLSGAIYLAKKITEGASKDDVNTLLPYLRGDKPVPPGWIIPVYDKAGKFTKVIEFP